MSDSQQQRPGLAIDLTGPDGNVFALVAKACQTLEAAGQRTQAAALRSWFVEKVPLQREHITYDDVRRKVEQYCDVMWLHEQAEHQQEPEQPGDEFQHLGVLYHELGQMLADVQVNFADMHPEDVAGILHNCQLKAMELAQEIGAHRQYILEEVLPDWEVTQSGKDTGMPPAGPADGLC